MACLPNLVFDPLPSGSCLPQELYDYLTTSAQIVMSGCDGCICFVKQSTPPGPEQLDYQWILESNTGVPLYQLTFYNGEWRRFPTAPIGAEVFFSGDPSLYFDPNTLFGFHGGQWDGWAIDTDVAGVFPVLSYIYSTTGLGWVVNWNGAETHIGGVQQIVLDNSNTFRPASNGLTLYGWEADGDHPGGAGRLLGLFNTGAPANVLIPADPGNPFPPPISTWPSFVAKAGVSYRGLDNS
jgi:hypothetical protein